MRDDVERPAHDVTDHARSDGVCGDAVDEQEATRVARDRVRVHRHRLVGGDLDATDVVHVEQARRMLMTRDDIESVADIGDGGRHGTRTGDEQVRATVCQRLLAQPHHVDGEAVCGLQCLARTSRDDIAAGHIDLVIEREGDGLAGLRALQIGDVAFGVQVVRHDAVDDGRAPRVGDDHRVTRRYAAGDDGAGVATEVVLCAHDELDRQAEGLLALAHDRLPDFQRTEQGGTRVPGHPLGSGGDVVADEGTDRDGLHIGHIEAGRSDAHLADDLLEGRMVVADQVHLVDSNEDGLHTHERADREVPVRLRTHSTRGIDHQHGDVAVGCGNRHVAGVLLMPRGVGDEDAAAVGEVHVTVGDVDRDALLALGLQTVGQQGVVDLPHGDRRSATTGASGVLEGVERHGVGLGEEAADERRLPVVDGATRHQVDDGGQAAGH